MVDDAATNMIDATGGNPPDLDVLMRTHTDGSSMTETLESPEHIPQAFVEAWNRKDAARLASLFDEDAEFVNVVGLWWHDREAIERAHAYGFERIFPDSTLKLVRVTVKQIRDDVAVVHARMRLTGQTPIGGTDEPAVRTNIFSFVVHHTDAGWRCASAHNTDVVPGVETNVIDEEGRLRPVDYREAR